MPRSGVAGLCGSSTFNFLKNSSVLFCNPNLVTWSALADVLDGFASRAVAWSHHTSNSRVGLVLPPARGPLAGRATITLSFQGQNPCTTLLLWLVQVFLAPRSPDPTTQNQPKTEPTIVTPSLIRTIYQGCACAKSCRRQSCRTQRPCLRELELTSDRNPTPLQVSGEA